MQDALAQGLVERAQPRRVFQSIRHHPARCRQRTQVGAQWIVIFDPVRRVGRNSGQPDIKRAIGLSRRQHRQTRRQTQDFPVETGPRQRLGLGGQAALPAEPVMGNLVGDGAQFHTWAAPQSPEKNCQPSANLGKVDCGLVMRFWRIKTTGKIVP